MKIFTSNIAAKAPLLLVFGILVFLSCEKPPNYSDEPEISFKDIETRIDQGVLNEEFQVFIRLNFKDGDGDLGIREDQAEDPMYDDFRDSVFVEADTVYCPDAPSTICEIFPERWDKSYNNLRIKMFKEDLLGNVTEVQLNSFLHQRFDPFLEDGLISPVDGFFRIRISHTISILQGTGLNKCDRVFYELALYDRKNHLSNTVRTETVRLFSDGLSCQ